MECENFMLKEKHSLSREESTGKTLKIRRIVKITILLNRKKKHWKTLKIHRIVKITIQGL